MNNFNPKIGQYDLIIKDLINSNNTTNPNSNPIKINKSNIMIGDPNNEITPNTNNFNNKIGGDVDKKLCDYTDYQETKIKELETHIQMLGTKLISNDYNNKIMTNYIQWINKIRSNLVKKLNENNLYYFFKFDGSTYKFSNMDDYWDVPDTEKLFSFSLFIGNPDNLTYLIGLVYNYAIMIKHFPKYKMRLYIDFHSVFGSPETFNIFNMFIDLLNDIDPKFMNTLQMVVFLLNPFYIVENESIFESITYDIDSVKYYYNEILYNTNVNYIKSPLLNMNIQENSNTVNTNGLTSTNTNGLTSTTNSTNSTNTTNTTNSTNTTNTANISSESTNTKKNINLNTENLEITYTNINLPTNKSTFSMFSSHISVNLRFLPLNENCEFHVRDLDSRLSLTDINIISKFANSKYQYVPFYVFQFYKFYFPYLKWRIDVNPYLAGCFGGNNRKSVMISKELEQSDNLKILKKELFFKYILFISFNATNLQIGFLNDEFILANIFEKIKGKYSENILYLNLGSFANKHVNEYYYGLNDSKNYPCMLKLGIPIDILRYPLNGKYLTIDPITDFKIGIIPLKYQNTIKNLITEQLKIYLGSGKSENVKLANKIRKNYKSRLDDEINDDLEAALFFSMIPKNYVLTGINEFNSSNYTSESFKNQFFSSVGNSTFIVKSEKLKATNFMMAGYLLSDILEDIIFPVNPQYINSNYYLSDDNYDRLFNCLYFDESNKKFVHRKVNKLDISKKYIDQNIIDHIPKKYLEFDNKEEVKKTLNSEFNHYLETCVYYPSMNWYTDKLNFNKFIQIEDKLIKSGLLIFIKNYTEPIYDSKNNIIYKINQNDVKTLKYDVSDKKNNINGILINKNKLKFNLILLDDKYINQLTYHNSNNKSNINIRLLKSNHLDKLANLIKTNKYNDFLIMDNL